MELSPYKEYWPKINVLRVLCARDFFCPRRDYDMKLFLVLMLLFFSFLLFFLFFSSFSCLLIRRISPPCLLSLNRNRSLSCSVLVWSGTLPKQIAYISSRLAFAVTRSCAVSGHRGHVLTAASATSTVSDHQSPYDGTPYSFQFSQGWTFLQSRPHPTIPLLRLRGGHGEREDMGCVGMVVSPYLYSSM